MAAAFRNTELLYTSTISIHGGHINLRMLLQNVWTLHFIVENKLHRKNNILSHMIQKHES